jgi:hypothetical protein
VEGVEVRLTKEIILGEDKKVNSEKKSEQGLFRMGRGMRMKLDGTTFFMLGGGREKIEKGLFCDQGYIGIRKKDSFIR